MTQWTQCETLLLALFLDLIGEDTISFCYRILLLLIPGVPASNQQVPLQVSTSSSTVTWFVDGALVGEAPGNERLFWEPTVGTHQIVVADPSGHKARRKLTVAMGQSQQR